MMDSTDASLSRCDLPHATWCSQPSDATGNLWRKEFEAGGGATIAIHNSFLNFLSFHTMTANSCLAKSLASNIGQNSSDYSNVDVKNQLTCNEAICQSHN
jgi:hypothetical protein